MEFSGEILAQRVDNLQQDIRNFLFVVTRVCYFHVFYEYLRVKVINVFTKTDASERNNNRNSVLPVPVPSCDVLQHRNKSNVKVNWDLRDVGNLSDAPDNLVVFRSTLPLCSETELRESASSTSTKKIARLEQEVEFLKMKLAAILSARESPRITIPASSKLPTMSSIPPPPPPPLPSLGNPTNPMDSIKKHIQENKTNVANPSEKRNAPDTPLLSLADVMKNARNVKLRHVERSPGGTPLRRPPLATPNDLNSILTQAMKRRFDVLYPQESPRADSSQWSPSPVRNSFGRRSARPSLSPLQEIAI